MATKTSDGTLAVKEGSLYWQLTAPTESPQKRPALVFLHAAVSDHTVWDGQVSHFAPQGWTCLRYDRFGFGRSIPDQSFLASNPREAIDHVGHLCQLIHEVLGPSTNVILIGLSMGGGTAFAAAQLHPELLAGLVIVAGGIPVGKPNDPREDALFDQAARLEAAGDVRGVAELQVRIWGDGPLQTPGRMPEALAAKMLEWNLDIARREIDKTGGVAFEMVETPPDPAKIKVPTAIAYGIFDETYTSTAMHYLGEHIEGAIVKGFPAGHMVPMEAGSELNELVQQICDASQGDMDRT